MNERADRSERLPAANRQERRHAESVARRIAAIYLGFGLLWIALSDEIIAYLVPAPLLSRVEMGKGFCFIAVTALLLFLLVRYYARSLWAEQLRVRRTLAHAGRDYQLLFQSNPLPMWIFDPKTLRILDANNQALLTYGYTREEFLRLDITALRPPEHIALLKKMLAELPAGVQHTVPIIHRKKNGEIFNVEIIGHGIQFHGTPARFVVAIDVTDRVRSEMALTEYRQQLEQRVQERTADLSAVNRHLQREIEERQKAEVELRAANQVAERASNAKSIFLANTTHEIRTPLTSILGYADLLVDPTLSDHQRDQYLAVLRKNASHLLRMIDDLLDLSRIETGNLRLMLDDYSPLELAEQSVELLQPRAAEKNLQLSLNAEEPLPAIIRTDGVRLRQVLLNLLSNAIKFTPAGSVSLAVRELERADAKAPWLQFTVADTGIGIAPEQHERIFEPFHQVEQSENRRYSGAGLGLAISRKLVDQMGGTLEVSSSLGRGSVFTLKIPCLAPASLVNAARPMIQKESRIGGRVLLAEDNANIRWLVEEYLRRAGATVMPVANGAEAIAAIERGASSPFDLVLLDINMPTIDGPEAMARIRELGFAGPIVALTAHSSAEEQRHFLHAGWDAVAAKPINRHTFIPLIARLIEERRHTAVQR